MVRAAEVGANISSLQLLFSDCCIFVCCLFCFMSCFYWVLADAHVQAMFFIQSLPGFDFGDPCAMHCSRSVSLVYSHQVFVFVDDRIPPVEKTG